MSLEAARAFRQQVNASASLREQVSSMPATTESLARLAVEHGHDVTPEDIERLMSDAELNSWELELVSGGMGGKAG